jgi:Spy/CpxP family protein refolding chaperone
MMVAINQRTEITMKRATKIAVAVGLALGIGAAVVVAQPYGMGGGMMGGGMGGPGMMGGGAMMGGGGMMGGTYNLEDRLAAQKTALKITPEQEDAWKAYADVAKKQSDAMLAQHEAMWKSTPSSSAERYELHSKFMAQRAQQHEALSTAYKSLYAVLTPEQRALADQRGGYGPGGRR